MEQFVRDVEEESQSRIVWAIEIRHERRACAPSSVPGPLPPMVKDWKHVGNCSLQSINWVNRSAEIAIVIGEAEARGTGVGEQACRWLLAHAFLRLGMERVWTGTAATNAAMRRVCDKIGMTEEGCFRHGMFLDGKHEDVIAYGITQGEYQSKYLTDTRRANA